MNPSPNPNRVRLIGEIDTAPGLDIDAEKRVSTVFVLMVDRPEPDPDGDMIGTNDVLYIPVYCIGIVAQSVTETLAAGDTVAITGSLAQKDERVIVIADTCHGVPPCAQ